MTLPTSIDDVLVSLRRIDATLPRSDGAAEFNRMYLTVTEEIAARVSRRGGETFSDPDSMADLDVRFARLWLAAQDAAENGRKVPTAWAPLFEARDSGRYPLQYALAGMNSHIEHDLPLAVVETCAARGLVPADVRADFDAVNHVLAQVESGIRRSFLDEVGRSLDDAVGPIVHLVSAWNIDKARDVAWVTAETLWALRPMDFLRDRFVAGLAHTVAMASRTLLAPTR